MTDQNIPPTPPAPPQPTPPAPQPPPAQSSTTRAGTRALAITFSVIGGCLLLGGGAVTAVAAVAQTTHSAGGGVGSESVSTSGIDSVRVDVDAGDMDVLFGGRSEARLDYSSDRGPWTLERDGDTLVVQGPDPRFSFFNWSFDQSATLTLPASLEGVDLDVDVAAGEFMADGSFGDITYELGAGTVELEGAARSVDGQVSAGSSIIELANVETATFDVAAGGVNGHLTGEAPEEVSIDVSAGAVVLELPDVPYDVRINRAAGDVTSSLQENTSSDRLVDVQVMAGDVELYAD